MRGGECGRIATAANVVHCQAWNSSGSSNRLAFAQDLQARGALVPVAHKQGGEYRLRWTPVFSAIVAQSLHTITVNLAQKRAVFVQKKERPCVVCIRSNWKPPVLLLLLLLLELASEVMMTMQQQTQPTAPECFIVIDAVAPAFVASAPTV